MSETIQHIDDEDMWETEDEDGDEAIQLLQNKLHILKVNQREQNKIIQDQLTLIIGSINMLGKRFDILEKQVHVIEKQVHVIEKEVHAIKEQVQNMKKKISDE